MTQSRVKRYRCCDRSRSAGSTFSLIETACRPDSNDRTRTRVRIHRGSRNDRKRFVDSKVSSVWIRSKIPLNSEGRGNGQRSARSAFSSSGSRFDRARFRSRYSIVYRAHSGRRTKKEARFLNESQKPRRYLLARKKSLPLSRLFLLPS